jgi:hypothetical protein
VYNKERKKGERKIEERKHLFVDKNSGFKKQNTVT